MHKETLKVFLPADTDGYIQGDELVLLKEAANNPSLNVGSAIGYCLENGSGVDMEIPGATVKDGNIQNGEEIVCSLADFNIRLKAVGGHLIDSIRGPK